MYKRIALLCLLTISSSAFADVCGIVTQSQAEKSLAFLSAGTKLTQTFSDVLSMTVERVTLSKSATMGGVDYYDLKVNGMSIDPGHVNIVLNENVSLNLGRLVGCGDNSDPDMINTVSIAKAPTK